MTTLLERFHLKSGHESTSQVIVLPHLSKMPWHFGLFELAHVLRTDAPRKTGFHFS